MKEEYYKIPLNYIEAGSKRYYRSELKKLDNIQVGNTIYENYDGVNMDTNSVHGGEVLRIRKLQKLGKEIIKSKDGKKIKKVRYLYSGYIYNTLREKDKEITDLDKEAYPVCFETSMRVEDIAKSKIKEIRFGFMKFLSDYESFEREETIKYIGCYYIKKKKDKEGFYGECWFEKCKISSSPTIQREIDRIKKEYLEKRNNIDSAGNNSNAQNTNYLQEYDDAR